MTDTTSLPAEPGLEDKGPTGWLHTSDHKRIGRMFITVALLFAGPAMLLDLLVRLDLTSDTDSPVLGADAFAQVFTLTRESLVLLVLIPVFLGLAIYLVPLQIGASNLAFPRAAALSFWGWLVSAGVLIGAYAGNGGPYGGWSNGVDLYLLALAGLVLSLLAGAISVGTTVLTMRAPGLFLDDSPPFSWSALVTSSMLVVALPVLLGQITILYIDHRYGEVFLGGNAGITERIDWLYQTPQLFIYVVPVLGIVAEIVLATARRRVFEPLALYFTIGLLGLFGFGAWANFGVTTEGEDITDGLEGIVLVGLYAGGAVAVTALLGLLGFTLLQARKRPPLKTAFVSAFGAGGLLLLGVGVGFLGAAADWLNIASRGQDGNPALRVTTFVTGQSSVLIYGAGLLGLLAALWWWAPKIWGVKLSEATGMLSFLLLGGGASLAWLGPVLSGAFAEQPEFVYHDPLLTTNYQSQLDSSSAAGLTALGAAGVIIAMAGLALALLTLARALWARARALRTGAEVAEVGSDPWMALSPEWLLDSPPAPASETGLATASTEPLPALMTGMPLLDDMSGPNEQ